VDGAVGHYEIDALASEFGTALAQPDQRRVAMAAGDQGFQVRVPVPQTAATRQQNRDIARPERGVGSSCASALRAPSEAHHERRSAAWATGCRTFSIGAARAASWSSIGSQPVASWRMSGTSSW
jgi:hypothetical protein